MTAFVFCAILAAFVATATSTDQTCTTEFKAQIVSLAHECAEEMGFFTTSNASLRKREVTGGDSVEDDDEEEDSSEEGEDEDAGVVKRSADSPDDEEDSSDEDEDEDAGVVKRSADSPDDEEDSSEEDEDADADVVKRSADSPTKEDFEEIKICVLGKNAIQGNDLIVAITANCDKQGPETVNKCKIEALEEACDMRH